METVMTALAAISRIEVKADPSSAFQNKAASVAHKPGPVARLDFPAPCIEQLRNSNEGNRMQARHVTALVVMVALALRLAAAHAAAPPCQLKMAVEHWPPYIELKPGAEPAGLDWELAQAILKEAGCTLQLLPELPAARRQREFQQGRLDLQLAASDTPERHDYARFSVAYRYETVAVFSAASQQQRYRGLASLDAIARQRLPLLAPKIGWYGPAYARLQPELEAGGRLSTFLSFQQGVRMLNAGRAGLIMGDTLALRHEARAQGVALAQLQFTVLRAPVHLMLNRASTPPAALDAINAAIARLEQQGVLTQIRARYGD
jgi:polar amino acid transport system substrate-binding protein